jgi:hypothetical protein
LPGKIGELPFLLYLFSPGNHGRGEVDTGDVLGPGGEGAGHQAGAASHVQDGVSRADPGYLQQQIEEGLLGMDRLLREGYRLPGELVEDGSLMPCFLVVLHCSYRLNEISRRPLAALIAGHERLLKTKTPVDLS